ncbi:heparan N-sulfatase [Bacteroidia bacterium]|nr:heparan N-sulfatase [Bacteroidia bacterium]
MSLDRFLTLLSAVAVSGGAAASLQAANSKTGGQKAPAQRPNVVMIIADDCNYYNIGCYGATNNATPAIDRLADEGMRFLNAWNSASMSAPTRHSLYTGYYPMHHGGYPNHSAIRPGIKTMPVYMSELGYRVGLAGKWHIKPVESFPFESVPGFASNCTTRNPSHTMAGVAEFVRRDQAQPFCLVVASVNPHAPWTGGDPSRYDPAKLTLPPNFVDTPLTRQMYAAYMAEVDLLDGEVAEVVDLLKRTDLYDNTLLIFVSEQGSQFAGAKWTNWTPGVKAAMIVRWPGRVKAGSVSEAIVQYEDILPTIVAAAGGRPGVDMDGRSMVDLLTGRVSDHRRYAFHVHNNVPEGPPYPIRSVGDGRYRLIWNLTPQATYVEKHIATAEWYKSWEADTTAHGRRMIDRWSHRPELELYDVAVDPFEMHNLADDPEHAAVRNRLLGELRSWMKEQNDPGASADRPVARPKPGTGQ